MTKNRFSKALKHIKKDLNEVAPTNSMSGVYSLNDPGYSLRHPSAPRTFLPDVDGNFPSGIPGTPGTPYIRPAGIWTGEKDWDEVITANFGHDVQGTDGNSTAGLIAENGVVYTALPPNSRSYILGPLVDGFVHNHGSDAYTRIGYIQKDTRQFVMLAYIRGTWKEGFVQETGAYSSSYNYPVWDGTTVNTVSGFHTYGSFTLADAQWMRAEILAGRYMKNTLYRGSGGVGQSFSTNNLGMPGYFYGGVGVGGGSGDAAVAGSGGGGGYGKGGDPTIGDQQTDPPKSGDAEDAGFPWFPFGKLGEKAKELWDNITDGLGDIKDNMEEFFNDAFDDAVEGAKDFKDSLQDALNNYQSSNQNQPSKDQSQKSNPIKDLGNQIKDWGNKFKNWKGIDGEGLTMGEKGQFAQEVLTTAFRLAAAVPAGNKAMQTFRGTNDPNSKDFGKHTPGHKNYEGPKEVEMSAGERTHISNQINKGFSELGIDTSTDRNLTAAEIKKISDYMAKGEAGVAGQFKGPDRSMPFYVTFWSLPPNVTTVSIKDGKVSKVNSNYLFTDETDVSIGKAITQIPMNNTAKNLAKYYEQNPDEKLVGGAYQSHTYTKEPFQKHQAQSDILVSVDGGKTYGLLSGYSMEQIQAAKDKGGIKTKSNPNAGKVDPNKNKVIGILNPMEIEMNFDTSKSKQKSTNKGQNLNFTTMGYTPDGDVLSERSNGLRKVKFVINEIASAPTTPTNQTTTQQPTESKETADALAKEYIEKNGPEKTKELIDKTDEYLSAHGAGEEEPPHTQSDVDRENVDQEVESDINANDELDQDQKETHKKNWGIIAAASRKIDADSGKDKPLWNAKVDNNFKIAHSILQNRVTYHTYPPNLINEYFDSIDSYAFTGGNFINAMPIVSSELGYADDNIYIENGVIRNNTSDTHQQVHHAALTNEQYFKGIGEGMSQLVIPSNGDEPYIIFKDYNYHNLRSMDPHEVPNILLDGLSGLVHAKGWINDVLRGSVSKSLGSGWPEGIHGAAYTEFKRPLSQLGVNIQNMIMSHPLYWTNGRYGELFADEQATEDEFIRSYKAIRSLPNGKNLVTNLQDEVYNKPEYSEFRSLWDTYESEYTDRQNNEKEIEKLKRELYYDFNSKYWGGYTDQDPDSPTFNQWIETPEKHFKFHDLSRQEQFELVGVSYPDFVKAEKALGLTSDGEVANWRQMLDGEQGLTGLAGKTVEAGDKLREIEKEFFAEFPESKNGGIFRTNDKAEAARWTKMYNKHQSAMTAYTKAWDEWDAAADPVYDTLNSVNDKYYQEYKPNEEDEYAKKKDEFEKQIEKLQNDWEIRQNELYGQMEPFYNQMFQEQIKLFHSTFFDKKFDLPSESWEPGSANSKSYEYDKYEPQLEDEEIALDMGGSIIGAILVLGLVVGGIDVIKNMSNWEIYKIYQKYKPQIDAYIKSQQGNIAVNPATGTSATDSAMLAGRRRRRGLQVASYKPKGRRLQESDLNLSRRQVRMLKEIKKPVSSFELLPQKLSKYKPNFKGKYSPQNTPDKTASKESDALVMSGNQKGQAWRTQDKYWSGYETQERMNVIMDRVGHGDLAWQMIVDEAREKNGWKNREIQEHLNIIAAEKGMREQVPDYESPFGYVIHEQGASTEEELDTVMKDPLVKKVAKRLRTQIDYKDKPSRKGFPDEPPAKQQDGWHPEYGKKYKYDKLDPQSAEAMPPTGNPEIDANVEKAKPKKPRWKHINTESKVDPKVKWEESVDWRSEIEINNSESLIEVENLDDFYERKQKLNERMTTSSVFSYSLEGSDADHIVMQTGYTGDGDINDFTHGDSETEAVHHGGEFTAFTSFTDCANVDDPQNMGTSVRSFTGQDSDGNYDLSPVTSDSPTGTGDGTPFWPGDTGGLRGTMMRQSYNSFPYTANGGPTTESAVGFEEQDEPQEGILNRLGSALLVGSGLAGNAGVPRLLAMKPVDTTEMDTFSMNWFTMGLIVTDHVEGRWSYGMKFTRDHFHPITQGDDIYLYYWAGDKPGAKEYGPAMSSYGSKTYTGWRPINRKWDGTLDDSVSPVIIPWKPHPVDENGDRQVKGDNFEYKGPYRGNTLYNAKVHLPEWCRGKNMRFMIVQKRMSQGAAYSRWGLTSLRFQRRAPMTVIAPLDSPEATAFIRDGSLGKEETTPQKRKKKVDRILKASKEYVNKIVADPFPGTEAEIGEAQGTSGNEYVPQAWDNKKQEFADAGTLDQQKDKFVSKDVKLPPNYSEVEKQIGKKKK